MRKLIGRLFGCALGAGVLGAVLLLAPGQAMAVAVLGEYSYLHVTFASVWHIFLFILVLVMMPFFFMIYHVWRHGTKTEEEDSRPSADARKEGDEQA